MPLVHRILFHVLVLLGLSSPALGTAGPIRCIADFGPFGDGKILVELSTTPEGTLEGRIASPVEEVSRESIEVREFPIRPGLDLNALNRSKPDFEKMNAGEQSLVHIEALRGIYRPLPAGQQPRLSFNSADVRSVKVYEFTRLRSKFGGVVLLEMHGPRRQLLGRVYRAVFASDCIDQRRP